MWTPVDEPRWSSSPFEIDVVIDGSPARRVGLVAGRGATVAALVAAVHGDHVGRVEVDGALVELDTQLDDAGVVHGSRLRLGEGNATRPAVGPWALAVVGGPAGGTVLGPTGSCGTSFVIGAVVVEVGAADGPVVHRRDGSTRTVRPAGSHGDTIVRLDDGTTVRVVPRPVPTGAPVAALRPGHDDWPWFHRFRPAPRSLVPQRPVAPPSRGVDDDGPRTGLDAAGLAGLLASLGLGLVTLSLLGGDRTSLRAALGILVALPAALRVGAEVRSLRRRRRAAVRAAADRSAGRRSHAGEVRRWAFASAPDPLVLEAIACGSAPGRWVRRSDDGDLTLVAVGEVRALDVDLSDDVWEPALARVGVLGIVGPDEVATAVARWVIAQLAVHGAPSVTAIDVSNLNGDVAWSWARWLPHAATAPSAVAPTAVVVTAGDDVPPGSRGVVVGRTWADLPPSCTSVVDCTDGPGRATLVDLGSGERRDDVRICGLDPNAARRIARALAPLRESDGESRLSGSVSFIDVVGLDPTDERQVRATWRSAGRADLTVAVGRAVGDELVVDLVAAGPHALVVGTTGSGKSELLRSWILGLAATYPPSHLTFVLADYKGGATFDGLGALPHVVASYDDLQGGADRLARGLRAELRRRERVLRGAGAESITAPTAASVGLPRLVVVVDEFTALAAERHGDLDELADVARAGRSLGLHLVLATQAIDAALSARLRANIGIRFDLRSSGLDGVDRIGLAGADPASWPPGRVLVRMGGGPGVMAQVARVLPGRPPPGEGEVRCVGADDVDDHPGAEVATIVAAIRRAAAGAVGAPSACTPPLPDRLDARTLAALIRPGSAPTRQTCQPIVWLEDRVDEGSQVPGGPDLALGATLVVGPPGSGVEDGVRVIVAGTGGPGHEREVHAYLLDDVPAHPGSVSAGVAVIRPDDDDRVVILLGRLRERLAQVDVAAGEPEIVVGIVDLAAAAASAGLLVEDLCATAIAAAHRRVRLVVGATAPRAVRGPVLASAGECLLLGGADPADLLLTGPPLQHGPPGRAVRRRTGCWVQFVEPDARVGPAAAAHPMMTSTSPTPAVPGLPDAVHAEDLGRAVVQVGGGVVVPLGCGGDPLGIVTVTADGGDVVLVVVRSSTTAERLTANLRCAVGSLSGTAVAVVVADRAGPDAAEAVARLRVTGVVVVVVAFDSLPSPFGHWSTRLAPVAVAVEETVMDRAADAFALRTVRHRPRVARSGVAHLLMGSGDAIRFRFPRDVPSPTERSQAA